MKLTPEQEAADAALAAALQQANNAYGFTGLVVGTVVCCATVEFDDDGDQQTGIIYHIPEGQNWVTTLGVIHATHLRLKAIYTTEDESE